jgi:signal peptidase I
MYDKRTHYSYAQQKLKRNQLLKIVLICFIFYIVYNCITSFFFSVWVVENNTMQPALASGDRIFFTSFSPPSFLRGNKNDAPSFLFKRGSIVLVDMERNRERGIPLRIIDGAVRFFTMQKASLFSGSGQYYIKRVIALPGDEISMNNYVFRVRTPGSSYSLTEFELSERPYHPAIPQVHELWNEAVPFSGTMEPLILGPNECFVISDDRSNTNDSRTWGVVSPSSITAKALLRFWPVVKIDLL